jgi:two-component system response regulator YesN
MLISKILYMFHTNFLLKQTNPTNQINEHEVVSKVKTYIMEKYAEPLSLAQIAEHVGISYSYLSSLFFQNTQESYSKYLTRIRLEHAASMLRHNPPEKISEIAEKVGYISAKHFSHLFKQQYGIPPGQYQEKFLR